MPHVNTARGPVGTDQLGFVLMHEHIVLQSTGSAGQLARNVRP